MDLFSSELDGDPEGGTYTVSRLGAEIQTLLREAYGSVWVAGEVQRLTARPNGHRYFELVEKGEDDAVVGKLDAVIWKGDFLRIAPVLTRHGQALAEGLAMRCRVAVDFYPPHGRLQLHVKEIDPVFTLGELARRREQTLAALAKLGLLDANRARAMPDLPLHVALVTSEGSAAYHDFLATLRESGYGFRVTLLHAAVQGIEAERQVASALAAAPTTGAECVALVRGGGSKSDLAAFDSRVVAMAVAECALPVLTGLGHEIDESVADRVAWRAFKTPTKVAEFLVARLAEGEGAMTVVAAKLARAGRVATRRAEERRVELGTRLRRAAPRALERGEKERMVLAWRLVGAARGRVATEAARLDGRTRLVAGLGPERTLARGFSITREASGVIVRDAGSVAAGERIRTTVARGTITSRVEEP
jgi:exodeoxyribonuclease VII large subunit